MVFKFLKKWYTKENAILILIISVVFLTYGFLVQIPFIRNFLLDLNQSLMDSIAVYGIPGIFFFSLIATTLLVIQIQTAPIIILFASQAPNLQYLTYMIIFSALGFGTGTIISFIWGKSVYTLIEKRFKIEHFEKTKKFLTKKPHLVPVFSFLIFMSPIPDEAVLLPLIILNYPTKKIIAPAYLGKLVFATSLCLAGFYAYNFFSKYDSRNLLEAPWFLLIFALVVIITLYKTFIKIKNNK